MAIKLSAFLATVCLLWAAEAKAITGNQWKELPEQVQQAYVIGVIDTWNNLAQIIEATEKPSRSEVLGLFTDSH